MTVVGVPADVWANVQSQREQLENERDDYRARKDEAYRERNKVVTAFAKLCKALGMAVGLMKHEGEPWEPDWRTLLFIKLPDGKQLTWHFHDSEVEQLNGFDFYPNMKWDGHDTPEKYKRLAEFDYNDPNQEPIKLDSTCAHVISSGGKCYKCDGRPGAPASAKTLIEIQHEEETSVRPPPTIPCGHKDGCICGQGCDDAAAEVEVAAAAEEPIDPHEPKWSIP